MAGPLQDASRRYPTALSESRLKRVVPIGEVYLELQALMNGLCRIVLLMVTSVAQLGIITAVYLFK